MMTPMRDDALAWPVFFPASAAVAAAVVVGCGSSATAPSAGAADAGSPVAPSEPSMPEGPAVGIYPRDTLPNIRLAGFRDDENTVSLISLSSELSDPDGSKGIHAIVITFGALSCPGCVQEARSLSASYGHVYRARGARFVSVIVPDLSADPIAIHALEAWRAKVVPNFMVLSDDFGKFVYRAPQFPYVILVDPRTMRVVDELHFIDPATRGCTSDADCCQANVTRDEYGPLCETTYLCAAWGLCVYSYNTLNPDSHLIGEIDDLLDQNGAPPGP
jgi:peroxiredoxin